MIDTINCELWLMSWSDTSKGGAKLVFQIKDDALEPFKSLTVANGKNAGQCFGAALVLVNDQGEAATLPAGPLCRLAAIWCRSPAFQDWIGMTWKGAYALRIAAGAPPEAAAKQVLCEVCQIESRKELDHRAPARERFNELIRQPFMQALREREYAEPSHA